MLELRQRLELRKRACDAVRAYFDARGFLEVETPIMVESPGLEPHLFPFETELVNPDGSRRRRYLHTSPEYAMKKLLGQGVGSIYQLARVFRNGERSEHHRPEFVMLEWYRQPGTLDALKDDVEALVAALSEALGVEPRWRTRRASMAQVFADAGLADPATLERPEDLAQNADVRCASDDTWEDVFFRVFLEKIEPTFGADELVIVDGWPASMAALAQLDPDDPRRALRFEAYLSGVEIANAFFELTDPVEQRRRFEAELETRRALGRATPPIDAELLDALPRMGRCAGIALGLDRTLSTLAGADLYLDARG